MTSTRKARKAQPANDAHVRHLPPADGGCTVIPGPWCPALAMSPERARQFWRDLEEMAALRAQWREEEEEEAARRGAHLRLVTWPRPAP